MDEQKKKGLMGAAMAMPTAEAPTQTAQAESPELPDDQFDEALNRITQAAMVAMESPGVQQQMAEAAAAPDQAQAIAQTANALLDGLDQQSGESIPEDVLPPAALAIVGMIGEAVEADQQTVGKAADLLMRMAAQEAGMSPEEIEAEMAAAAQQQEV